MRNLCKSLTCSWLVCLAFYAFINRERNHAVMPNRILNEKEAKKRSNQKKHVFIYAHKYISNNFMHYVCWCERERERERVSVHKFSFIRLVSMTCELRNNDSEMNKVRRDRGGRT